MNAQIANELGPDASEVKKDAWQSRQAKSYITAEPDHAFKAAIHRIRSLWNTVPLGDGSGGVGVPVITAVGWYYTIVLTVALFGACRVICSVDCALVFHICFDHRRPVRSPLLLDEHTNAALR